MFVHHQWWWNWNMNFLFKLRIKCVENFCQTFTRYRSLFYPVDRFVEVERNDDLVWQYPLNHWSALNSCQQSVPVSCLCGRSSGWVKRSWNFSFRGMRFFQEHPIHRNCLFISNYYAFWNYLWGFAFLPKISWSMVSTQIGKPLSMEDQWKFHRRFIWVMGHEQYHLTQLKLIWR